MAIPIEWREKLSTHPPLVNNYCTEPKLFMSAQNEFKQFTDFTSRELYDKMLINSNSRHVPASKVKWEESLSSNILNWKLIYSNAFKSCRSTKLQSFQYKIINRVIACNHWLFNIKIKDNPNCDSCKIDDTLAHFFIECVHVKPFWISFKQWWKRCGDIQQTVSDVDILLGYSTVTPNKCLNYLLIQAKKYIYDKKMNEIKVISFYSFLHHIKTELILEKSICDHNGNLNYFEATFGCVFNNL